jgi:hypothetical protein
MRRTLQIPPVSSPGFIAALLEIFDALRPEADALTWVMWGDVWLTAQIDSERDVVALERHVTESPRGVRFGWDELLCLLQDLTQVIDGTFIGTRDVGSIPEIALTDLSEIHRTYELVVTADDSSFWWISGPSYVVERFALAFPHGQDRASFR